MARKPAHLELVGGKGLRQRVWDRIRAMKGAEFSLRDVVLGGESQETARDYLVGLSRAGILAFRETPNGIGRGYPAKHYSLARDAGAEAPRVRRDGAPVTQGLAQEQMWRTLRMLPGDTNARELAAHASSPEVAVAESAAKDYIKNLHTAGYLLRTREGKGVGTGGVQARYRLNPTRNTGPRPPMVCRTKLVWDANENKIVWQPPVSEEDAIYAK